jgi:hypothetical protein
MSRHVLDSHFKNSCPICIASVPTIKALQRHFKTKHPCDAEKLSNKYNARNYYKYKVIKTNKSEPSKTTAGERTAVRVSSEERDRISEESSPERLSVVMRRIRSPSATAGSSSSTSIADSDDWKLCASSSFSGSPIASVKAIDLPQQGETEASSGAVKLKCLHCTFARTSRAVMNKHVFVKHLNGSCPMCHTPAVGFESLYSHFRKNHPHDAEALIASHQPGCWYSAVSVLGQNQKPSESPLSTPPSAVVKKENLQQPQYSSPTAGTVRKQKALATPVSAASSSATSLPASAQASGASVDQRDVPSTSMDSSAEDMNSFNIYIDNAVDSDGGDNEDDPLMQSQTTTDTSTMYTDADGNFLVSADNSQNDNAGEGMFETVGGQVFTADHAATLFLGPQNQQQTEEQQDFSDVKVRKDSYSNLALQLWAGKEGSAAEDMEYRCPHCTADFLLACRFYEHICYHYHYRCFRCEHCGFLAFAKTAIFNHCMREHLGMAPAIGHLKKERMEQRIARVIHTNLVQITAPYAERRLKAYERARLKKLDKQRESAVKREMKARGKSEAMIAAELARQKSSPGKETKKAGKASKKEKVACTPIHLPRRTVKPGVFKWLICPYCRKERKTQTGIEREIRYHIHYKPFSCGICDFTSSSLDFCVSHTESVHPSKPLSIRYDRVEIKEERFLALFNRAVMLSTPTGTIPGTDQVPIPDQGQSLAELLSVRHAGPSASQLHTEASTSSQLHTEASTSSQLHTEASTSSQLHTEASTSSHVNGSDLADSAQALESEGKVGNFAPKPKGKKKKKKGEEDETYSPNKKMTGKKKTEKVVWPMGKTEAKTPSPTKPAGLANISSGEDRRSRFTCCLCSFSFKQKNLSQDQCNAMLEEHMLREHGNNASPLSHSTLQPVNMFTASPLAFTTSQVNAFPTSPVMAFATPQTVTPITVSSFLGPPANGECSNSPAKLTLWLCP